MRFVYMQELPFCKFALMPPTTVYCLLSLSYACSYARTYVATGFVAHHGKPIFTTSFTILKCYKRKIIMAGGDGSAKGSV